MTDTGQVPGEGLPENAGGQQEGPGHPVASGPVGAEQPGYAFHDHGAVVPNEEDQLLMPGAQGAWSDQQLGYPMPPAYPQDAVHPQESLYLSHDVAYAHDAAYLQASGYPQEAVPGAAVQGGDGAFAEPAAAEQSYLAEQPSPAEGPRVAEQPVRPEQAVAAEQPAPPVQPVAQVPPARRPLHLGPPVPESTGGVVRSLSDRGPAHPTPPPVRHAGPPTLGPEYLDVQQAQPSGYHYPSEAAEFAGAQPGAAAEAPAAWGPEQDGRPLPEAPAAGPADEHVLSAEQSALAEEPAPVGEADAGSVPEQSQQPLADDPAVSPVGSVDQQASAEFVSEEPAPDGDPDGEPADAALATEQHDGLPGHANEAEAATLRAEPEPGPAAQEPVAEPAPEAAPQPVAEAEPEAGTTPEPASVATEPEAVDAVAGPAEPAADEVTVETPGQFETSATEEQIPGEQPAVTARAETEAGAAEAQPGPEAEADEPETQPELEADAEDQQAAETQAEAEPEAAADAEAGSAAEPEPGSAPEAESEQPETEDAAEDAAEAGPALEADATEDGDPERPTAADGVAEDADPLEVTGPAEPGPDGQERPRALGYGDAEREAVMRVIRERRDIRNGFRPDPVPHDVLLRVLEAAHTAPSVGHSQPWDFVVIRSAETRRAMHELAARQREAYAKSLPKGRAKQFKALKVEAILDTPVNIVVTADPTRGGRHTLGRHTQPQMAPYSSALAVENLWLAARAEGLGVGWVSFFDEREMVRELGLPEHLEVVAYLCVGYVDEFPDEPELMQSGWSKRRPLSWVVHEETYGRRALPGEDPHDLLAETLQGIRPLDAKALGEAWERQKRMTKPAGALGMLEIISAQLCGLSRKCPPPVPEPAAVAVFAGDHGVHAQGVTPWPQEVTAQMVANFLDGGAVCNAFASQVGAEVCVVDVGVAVELPGRAGLLPRKVRPGSDDFTEGPALSREDVMRAVEVGIETARDLVAAGNKALVTGEMGIANTTVSAALISVYTGMDPAEVTGRGTGINDEMHARKVDIVRKALELHQPDPADPIGVLAAVGGLEHAALVGLLLGGASMRTPVILDGVSAGAAALIARAIAPEALAACIAGHRSAEPGHVAALTKLGLRPLIDLDLRLGEGTGALLALPIVQSAARAMHEVATFDAAGVTEKN
ncbi:nicotinate-nucleotide--dimethylbenzimidazole phosphoribosyltransferase [Streptomyces meridianus]|uniref:Nicotinate-nucleotide--dimethylbenzimidazole phosphoribosyltransferase n=1 Tax=Streptomyces meridianus TaxID=2938945 RepID=A0ABT0X3J3_9ACTN|nr:nicotinate-nucleotide--dimethylbenzimidazole phosphoribosyltransferase [Streptomyces meridianus]MCM2577103.1 nicotinate-nucleotide--dimethylbenzimidazole phosphoribosyltransferase [Streptomyces meridianus]